GFAFAQEHMWEDREEVYFKNHTFFSKGVQDGLATFGNGLTLYAGALTWYFIARANENVEGYEKSKALLSALTVTSAATLVLKGTFHDGRPNGASHDFPSGHASLSMTTAATLDELCGHGIGIPAYAMSGLVGLQRLDSGKHDTGAVL